MHDGDGTADALWRDASTGKLEGWLMNADQWFGSVSLGNSDPAWQFAGAGEFGLTGGADVLWHNPTTGQTGTWLLHQT